MTAATAATAARRLQSLSQGRLMVVVVLLLSAFVLFLPARQLVQQRSEMGRLTKRLEALEAENRRLASEVARLQDPDEVEALARGRLGLVRPGEEAYSFGRPSATSAPAPADEPRQTAHHGRSALSRAWSWLANLVRGSG